MKEKERERKRERIAKFGDVLANSRIVMINIIMDLFLLFHRFVIITTSWYIHKREIKKNRFYFL